MAFCDCILDSHRCDVAEFPVGFTDSHLYHHNACIVDGKGFSCCCYMVEAIGIWDCCQLPLNVAEHFMSLSWLTEMGVNTMPGSCMAFLRMVLVHFTLFGGLIHTSPFLSTLSLQPLAVVIVVLLIGE